MPMMLYAAAAVGIVIVLLMGALKISSVLSDGYKAQAKAAESANATLAADCAAKINKLTADIKAISAGSAKRAKDAKAAADKSDKVAAAQADIIAKLAKDAQGAADSADNCARATDTLNSLAKDRNGK